MIWFHPAAAFRALRDLPVAANRWTVFRRALLVAAVLGCCISLMTEGRLTLRLAAPSAIWWSFVPLLQIGCAAAAHRIARPKLSLARTIDLSFLALGPWALWLIGYAAVWGFVSPVRIYGWQNDHRIWSWAAGLAAIWSAYIDFWFFRVVMGAGPLRAGGSLLLQRSVCLAVCLVIFVLSAGWQVVASGLGL